MALDSRDKRGAAIGFGNPWNPVFPLPDASIGQADRQQTAYSYPGILAVDLDVPVPPIETVILDFEYADTATLDFDYEESSTLDFDYIQSITLDF